MQKNKIDNAPCIALKIEIYKYTLFKYTKIALFHLKLKSERIKICLHRACLKTVVLHNNLHDIIYFYKLCII